MTPLLKLVLYLTLWPVLIPALLTNCSNSPPLSNTTHVINGRTTTHLYRIIVPTHWQRDETSTTESLLDTKVAICTYFPTENIRITIHNFPSNNRDDRIPVDAQINRWQKQFETLDNSSTTIIPQSFSGYTGKLLSAQGTIEGRQTQVMGWAMQLGPDQYRMLSNPKYSSDHRADVTIKVVGPPEEVELIREDIVSFARSFEQIDEIPSP